MSEQNFSKKVKKPLGKKAVVAISSVAIAAIVGVTSLVNVLALGKYKNIKMYFLQLVLTKYLISMFFVIGSNNQDMKNF